MNNNLVQFKTEEKGKGHAYNVAPPNTTMATLLASNIVPDADQTVNTPNGQGVQL